MQQKLSSYAMYVALLLSAAASVATAAGQMQPLNARLAPRLLNYQGYLTDTLGNPVTNPSLSLTFAIFDAASAGTQKWSETQSAVSVDKGIFNVLLGSVSPIPDSVFLNSTNRWLEMTVGGQTLSPRTRIVSSAYAYTSTYSDTAQYAKNATADADWIISGNNMYSGVSGNVGIGTSSPGAKLDVTGHIWQTGTGYSAFLGEGAGFNDDLSNNFNVFVGYNTGYSNTTGSYNTASGYYALHANTTGNYNTASGTDALYSNTTGNSNTASGMNALFNNTSGNYNTASGMYALYANTTGDQNTASGYRALYSNTTASHNIALGERALYTQSYDNGGTAWNSFNIAIGDSALYRNQPTSTANGNYNTALGHRALRYNTTGNYNTASGNFALRFNTDGYSNTASGYQALYSNTDGYSNTASGYQALNDNTTGDRNTAFGRSSGPTNDTVNNTSALGYLAQPTANNRVHIGNTYVAWIGGSVSWSTYSDARAKSDVRDNIPGLAFITRLKPVSFKWDTDALNKLMDVTDDAQWDGKYDIEKNRISGFLAQDVAKAARDCGYDFSGIDSTADVYSLSYAQFVVPLVKAVQEQQTQLEIQHAEIAELRAQIKALQDRK